MDCCTCPHRTSGDISYLDDSRVDDEGNEMTWLDHLQEKMPDLQSPSFADTYAEQSEMQTILARLNEIMPQAIIIGQLREQGLKGFCTDQPQLTIYAQLICVQGRM